MIKAFWRRRKWSIALVVGMLGLLCVIEEPARAFLSVVGLADLVYDPAVQASVDADAGINTANLGVNSANLGVNSAALAQDIMIAETAAAEYMRIDAATRGTWTMSPQMPNIDMTQDTKGELAGMAAVLNGTVGLAPAVWAQSTRAIDPSPDIWSEQTPGHSAVLGQLASIEAIDGSSSRCLDQIAQVRGNWSLNQPMIMSLNASQVDDTDPFNGTVGQINIGNNTAQQGNEERRTQTAVQSCLVEQNIWQNKISRDRLTAALNQQTKTRYELQNMPTGWDGGNTFTQLIP